ncbi:MAG: CopG family transcriptional regulator [Bacteroidia bacterium]|nr:CopG family transcriptional regulator [Bacteroidia bacterium]
MEKRIGTITILLHDPAQACAVNHILSEYSSLIIGRLGLPSRVNHKSIIALVVEATTDHLGALTGKLGRVNDISVKSAVFPSSATELNKHKI